MTTFVHRATELGIGTVLVGYCIYAVCSGEVLGKFRRYDRNEDPWSFWATVLIALGIGAAFLLGAIAWRGFSRLS
jgi:hypothetical protein